MESRERRGVRAAERVDREVARARACSAGLGRNTVTVPSPPHVERPRSVRDGRTRWGPEAASGGVRPQARGSPKCAPLADRSANVGRSHTRPSACVRRRPESPVARLVLWSSVCARPRMRSTHLHTRFPDRPDFPPPRIRSVRRAQVGPGSDTLSGRLSMRASATRRGLRGSRDARVGDSGVGWIPLSPTPVGSRARRGSPSFAPSGARRTPARGRRCAARATATRRTASRSSRSRGGCR